ncbi:hypothetical protein OSB04_017599 [Centaurea solstitialis]|uniref:Uncharacterized protein n=1 Tax=Centaurea solstitialis TaxID=347529 RepID=A0AA38T4T8_9ASTR|nr:hypothetical protein OSB04_017599 [Centaurea solstitialis]
MQMSRGIFVLADSGLGTEHDFLIQNGDGSRTAKALELDNELRNIVIGDSTIMEYCSRIKGISDLLTNIGSPVSERNLVTYAINGLSPKYDVIATTIRHRSPFPSFLEMRSILTLEEQRMLQNQNRLVQVSHSDTSSLPTILNANHNYWVKVAESAVAEVVVPVAGAVAGSSKADADILQPLMAADGEDGLSSRRHSLPRFSNIVRLILLVGCFQLLNTRLNGPTMFHSNSDKIIRPGPLLLVRSNSLFLVIKPNCNKILLLDSPTHGSGIIFRMQLISQPPYLKLLAP